MVTRNDPARPANTPVGGYGDEPGDVDAARHVVNRGTDRSADRNAELDTVEHDLRDFRR